jgi:hypothetical protein
MDDDEIDTVEDNEKFEEKNEIQEMGPNFDEKLENEKGKNKKKKLLEKEVNSEDEDEVDEDNVILGSSSVSSSSSSSISSSVDPFLAYVDDEYVTTPLSTIFGNYAYTSLDHNWVDNTFCTTGAQVYLIYKSLKNILFVCGFIFVNR